MRFGRLTNMPTNHCKWEGLGHEFSNNLRHTTENDG